MRDRIMKADSRWITSFNPECKGSVDCGIGSPPYWGQRWYGDSEEEIGRPDQPFVDYLVDMGETAKTMHWMLADDAIFWLNIGDTNAGSGGAGGDYNSGGRRDQHRRYRQGECDIPDGQLVLVPYEVANVWRSHGWYVRQDITWVKTTKTVPEGDEHGRNRQRPEDQAHVRRPTFSTEHIFMLTKGPAKSHRYVKRPELEQGNAWHFPPSSGNGHAAPYPAELVRRCLLHTFEDHELNSSNPPIVFDPWAGSGTTLDVTDSMGLRGWGTDLYAD